MKQYRIGYQIRKESLEKTAREIADLSVSEFIQMRDRTVRCFCENFSEEQFISRVKKILEDV